jgi:bacterioferritin
MEEFLTDVMALRGTARREMVRGPITGSYGRDLERIVRVLNQALAVELIGVVRYKRHYFAAEIWYSQPAADEFLQRAVDKSYNADAIAARIQQMGSEPDLCPDTLTRRSRSQFLSAHELEVQVREDLVAERVALGAFAEIVTWLGESDPPTRRILEHILAMDEERAEEMRDLLAGAM